ncbi:MAG: hypothetical protein C0592_09280 [Marinilabiliales bacterium]|nr:MAG: hypothetical protein C0592_09280 [Marinilabiliales bacterium]
MEVLYKKKADINEGIKNATVSKSAMIFFKDVFFTIPYSQTHILGGESRFNGKEIFDHSMKLLDENKSAELYDYLLEAVPDEYTYYINMLDVFKIKISWWIFGGMYFRKKDAKGQRRTVGLNPKSFRVKLAKFYNLDV